MALEDPATQAYPAAQGPLQEGETAPVVAPYLPASHAPVQVARVAPVEDPYRPAGHRVHTPVAPVLYRPAGHRAAVALVEPETHA